jgi:serine/threonine protein kinase
MTKLSSKDTELDGAGIPNELIRSPIHRKYRLTSVIKEDFQGMLYKSARRSDGVNLTVKLLSSDFCILTELIGKVDHSRITRVHDHIIDKAGLQAVVFKMPAGRCLTELTADASTMTEGEAVSAALQLLSAIHAVHWCDELVGNLHSDSIYLSRDIHDNLELELLNVGIGCADNAVIQPYYQAPEQISGTSANHRADIWAAGVILYEMLFGQRPFEGESRYEIGGEILLKDPSYQNTWTNIPDDLTAVVRRALMKDPGRRYDNVSSMISALLPFQAEFKEPMSEAASAAIRDSYPPPGEGKKPVSRRSLASKPIEKLTKGLKSITPGVKSLADIRRSADPDPASAPKKFATPLPAVRSKLTKKTMLGIPAISLPEKRYQPRRIDPEPSSPSPSPWGDGRRNPLSTLPVDEAPYGDLSDKDASSVEPSRLIQAAGIASDTLKSLWIKNKRVAVIAGAAVVAVVVTLSLVLGEEAPAREGDAPLPGAGHEAPTPPPAAETPATPPPAEPVEPAAEPLPESVVLTINGLPAKAVITINDEEVTSPVTLPYSQEPVEITFKKRGFETQVMSFVPRQDTILDISMEKRERPVKRSVHRKTKKNDGKPKTSSNNLADNPFGD